MANLCGWFTQAAALRVGSVAAVQPLMSTQLLFVMALASRFVMAKVLGLLPAPAQPWFARTVYRPGFLQGIVSNMLGPTAQLSLLDVPFEAVSPILPLAPDAPLALGALSWTGKLGIGLAVDPRFLRAEILATAMQDVFDELAGVAVTDSPRRS